MRSESRRNNGCKQRPARIRCEPQGSYRRGHGGGYFLKYDVLFNNENASASIDYTLEGSVSDYDFVLVIVCNSSDTLSGIGLPSGDRLSIHILDTSTTGQIYYITIEGNVFKRDFDVAPRLIVGFKF